MGRWQERLDRLEARFLAQSDVRRAAILGSLFGLLLCVVLTLSCLLLSTIPMLR